MTTPVAQSEAHYFYRESFDGDSEPHDSRRAKALACALDVRKFEIELYWKRAAYFWAFTAAAFAAYIAILSAKDFDGRPRALLLVSCLGVVFAVAWYLVNRASKYWQTNWERHVDLMENGIMGPLYKTVLGDKVAFWKLESAYPFSVSRINQLLSFIIVLFFLLLVIDTLRSYYSIASRLASVDLVASGCLFLTALAVLLFLQKGRSGRKVAPTSAEVRETRLDSYSQARTNADRMAAPSASASK